MSFNETLSSAQLVAQSLKIVLREFYRNYFAHGAKLKGKTTT